MNSKINTELSKIQEWLNLNKLSLNVKKTKYIVFHHKGHNTNVRLSLSINNTPIERVKTFRFLGLVLNETLTWSDHILDTANKISKTLGIMSRLKNTLPGKVLKLIYTSLILPRLHYCNLAWGHKPERLNGLQKRAIRLITKSKYNAHTEPLYKEMKQLNLQDIHISNKLKFFYKLENNRLPSYFWTYMFQENRSNRTRSRDPYQQLVPKTAIFSTTIRFSLPTLLKNTPPLIKAKAQTHSYNGFSNYVKQAMLQKYKTTCDINHCYICNKT